MKEHEITLLIEKAIEMLTKVEKSYGKLINNILLPYEINEPIMISIPTHVSKFYSTRLWRDAILDNDMDFIYHNFIDIEIDINNNICPYLIGNMAYMINHSESNETVKRANKIINQIKEKHKRIMITNNLTEKDIMKAYAPRLLLQIVDLQARITNI